MKKLSDWFLVIGILFMTFLMAAMIVSLALLAITN